MICIYVKKVTEKKEQHQEAVKLAEQLTVRFGGQQPVTYHCNVHGKPYLDAPNDCIFINWSHSGEYVICAAADQEIGIDLQHMKMEPKASLVRRTLGSEELAYYENVLEEEQKKLFYQYWAVKESFLKALGTGFSAGLKGFRVQMEQGQPKIVQNMNKKEYVCRLLEFADADYAAAVCCEQEPGDIVIEYL